MRQPLLVCLAILMTSGARGLAQGTAGSASGVIVAKFAGPMLAVARLMTEEKWNPTLDRGVQDAPVAKVLGGAWTPADPRWQKARKAVGARMTRILDSYAQSGEVTKHLETRLARMTPADVDAIVAALNGPAGPAIVRSQTSLSFIVMTMSETLNGPKIGGPEWTAQLGALTRKFDERLGAAMPKDDGTHKAEVERFSSSPVRQTQVMPLWDFVIANGTRQLGTAINLMLLDDREAISRDIANAVAGR